MENFEIIDGVVVSYFGKEENVVIPEFVTKIGKEAFKENNDIKSVTIPDSVEVIGESAFELCENLTSVRLPKNLKVIESFAFSECTSLSDVTLPLGVEEIYPHAFFECRMKEVNIGPKLNILGLLAFGGFGNLVTSFNVSKDNEHFSSVNGVLYNKDKTKLLMYPQKRYEECFTPLSTVKEIYDYAFTSLSNFDTKEKAMIIKINEGAAKIGEKAFFADIGAGDVYLPSSIEEIGEEAFASFGITSGSKVHVIKGSKSEELLRLIDNVNYVVE